MSDPAVPNIFGVAHREDYLVIEQLGVSFSVETAINLAAWIAALTESEEVFDMALRIEAQEDAEDIP